MVILHRLGAPIALLLAAVVSRTAGALGIVLSAEVTRTQFTWVSKASAYVGVSTGACRIRTKLTLSGTKAAAGLTYDDTIAYDMVSHLSSGPHYYSAAQPPQSDEAYIDAEIVARDGACWVVVHDTTEHTGHIDVTNASSLISDTIKEIQGVAASLDIDTDLDDMSSSGHRHALCVRRLGAAIALWHALRHYWC